MRPLSCRHWVPRGETNDHTSTRWELCAFLHETVGRGRFLGVLAFVQLNAETQQWEAAVNLSGHTISTSFHDLPTAIEWADRTLSENDNPTGALTVRDLEVK